MIFQFQKWSDAHKYGIALIDNISDAEVRLSVRDWVTKAMFRWRDRGDTIPNERCMDEMVSHMTKSIAHRMVVPR